MVVKFISKRGNWQLVNLTMLSFSFRLCCVRRADSFQKGLIGNNAAKLTAVYSVNLGKSQ